MSLSRSGNIDPDLLDNGKETFLCTLEDPFDRAHFLNTLDVYIFSNNDNYSLYTKIVRTFDTCPADKYDKFLLECSEQILPSLVFGHTTKFPFGNGLQQLIKFIKKHIIPDHHEISKNAMKLYSNFWWAYFMKVCALVRCKQKPKKEDLRKLAGINLLLRYSRFMLLPVGTAETDSYTAEGHFFNLMSKKMEALKQTHFNLDKNTDALDAMITNIKQIGRPIKWVGNPYIEWATTTNKVIELAKNHILTMDCHEEKFKDGFFNHMIELSFLFRKMPYKNIIPNMHGFLHDAVTYLADCYYQKKEGSLQNLLLQKNIQLATSIPVPQKKN